jgi:hypothetical protein
VERPDGPLSDGPRVTVIGPTNADLFIRGDAPLDAERLRTWVGPSEVSVVAAGSVGYTVQAWPAWA